MTREYYVTCDPTKIFQLCSSEACHMGAKAEAHNVSERIDVGLEVPAEALYQ